MQIIFRIVNSGHVVNAESQSPKRRKLDTTVAANTAANVHAIFLKRDLTSIMRNVREVLPERSNALAVQKASFLKNMQRIFRTANSGNVLNATRHVLKRRRLDTTAPTNSARSVYTEFLKRDLVSINVKREAGSRNAIAVTKCSLLNNMQSISRIVTVSSGNVENAIRRNVQTKNTTVT